MYILSNESIFNNFSKIYIMIYILLVNCYFLRPVTDTGVENKITLSEECVSTPIYNNRSTLAKISFGWPRDEINGYGTLSCKNQFVSLILLSCSGSLSFVKKTFNQKSNFKNNMVQYVSHCKVHCTRTITLPRIYNKFLITLYNLQTVHHKRTVWS